MQKIVITFLFVMAFVQAADQTVVYNASQSIQWEVRNGTLDNSPITDATCNLNIYYAANNATFWENYTNQYISGATYSAVINGSFPLNSYLAIPNCTVGTSWETTSFTFDVVTASQFITIGGGGLTNEVLIFLVIIICAVYIGTKYYLDTKTTHA